MSAASDLAERLERCADWILYGDPCALDLASDFAESAREAAAMLRGMDMLVEVAQQADRFGDLHPDLEAALAALPPEIAAMVTGDD